MYVLDTDILSLHQRGHPVIAGHIAAHPPANRNAPLGRWRTSTGSSGLHLIEGAAGEIMTA
jgi:hypothetical protein